MKRISGEWSWRTVVTLLLIPLLVLGSSGCATMFNPRHQEVPVTSTPEGAEVWIDGEVVGVTPVTVTVKADENHEVVVKLGDEERAWALERRKSAGGVLGLAGDVLILVPTGLVGGILIGLGIEGGSCAFSWGEGCAAPDAIPEFIVLGGGDDSDCRHSNRGRSGHQRVLPAGPERDHRRVRMSRSTRGRLFSCRGDEAVMLRGVLPTAKSLSQ